MYIFLLKVSSRQSTFLGICYGTLLPGTHTCFSFLLLHNKYHKWGGLSTTQGPPAFTLAFIWWLNTLGHSLSFPNASMVLTDSLQIPLSLELVPPPPLKSLWYRRPPPLPATPEVHSLLQGHHWWQFEQLSHISLVTVSPSPAAYQGYKIPFLTLLPLASPGTNCIRSGSQEWKLGKSSKKKDWTEVKLGRVELWWIHNKVLGWSHRSSGEGSSSKFPPLRQQVRVMIPLCQLVIGCGLPLGRGGGVTLGEVAVFSWEQFLETDSAESCQHKRSGAAGRMSASTLKTGESGKHTTASTAIIVFSIC